MLIKPPCLQCFVFKFRVFKTSVHSYDIETAYFIPVVSAMVGIANKLRFTITADSWKVAIRYPLVLWLTIALRRLELEKTQPVTSTVFMSEKVC